MGTQPKTIAIDFDGVIHAYTKGWQDGKIYDEPVASAFTVIGSLFDTGYSVFVFTTRNKHDVKRWIEQQIMISDYEHRGPGNDPFEWVATRYGYTCRIVPFWKKFWNEKNVLGITNRKLPAHCYVDDRALTFEGDWL
jgi:hypothetical protein